MSYVRAFGSTEWEQGLGETDTGPSIPQILAKYEAQAARKVSKYGDRPISGILRILKPKMDVIRDAVTYAIEFLGPAAAVRVGSVALADLKPEQPADSRLTPADRETVQDMRAMAAWSFLVNAPAQIGYGPLAMGLAKALWKRGKWPQSRLNDVIARVRGVASSFPAPPAPPPAPSSLPPPPAPKAPPRPSLRGYLGEAAGDSAAAADLTAAEHDSGTQTQAEAGKDGSVITPEMVAALLEILKLGIPLATELVKQAGGAAQKAPPPQVPGKTAPFQPPARQPPQQQAQAQTAQAQDGGFPWLLLAAAAGAYALTRK